MTTSTPTAPARSALRARDIADLTTASGFPCISVLLPTEPAPRMTLADQDRLRAAVHEVREQLRAHEVIAPDPLLRKLELEVQQVASAPTDRGLAIYVSLALTRSFRLPQAVDARVVVERTFATRALVSALHRMPPHAVLVVHAACAHLYSATDGELTPVAHVDPFPGGRGIRVPRPGDPAGAGRDEHTDQYLRTVDKMLGDYRREHPSPLVLAGTPALLDRFCLVSRNTERLAGRVDPAEADSAVDLALVAARVVRAYLRQRRDGALTLLEDAVSTRPEDVCSGITACWRAVPSRQPGMLLVEEHYVCPGQLTLSSPDDDGATVAEEVHDLVDDLIEQVISQGGQLALVRDGDLAAHDRIALVLRPRRRRVGGEERR